MPNLIPKARGRPPKQEFEEPLDESPSDNEGEEEASIEDEMQELEKEEQRGYKPHGVQKKPRPLEQKKATRYSAFAINAREGIMDVESKEVIAENIWDALANIIERLERIENTQGSMLAS